jgi:hypothetical protein
MTVESVTYISDLNATYPAAGDVRSEGDDHIRNLKTGIKTTFPNVSGAVLPTHAELNLLDGVTGTLRSTTTGPLAGEWTLIGSTAVSGAPAAVDFVHGTSDVVIDDTYVQYEIVLDNIDGASSAVLWLRASDDAGVSWSGVGTWTYQYSTLTSGTAADGNGSTDTKMALTGALTVGTGAAGRISIVRSSTDGVIWVTSQLVFSAGSGHAVAGGKFSMTGVNGFRLVFASGNFANQGSVKLYGRKP